MAVRLVGTLQIISESDEEHVKAFDDVKAGRDPAGNIAYKNVVSDEAAKTVTFDVDVTLEDPVR